MRAPRGISASRLIVSRSSLPLSARSDCLVVLLLSLSVLGILFLRAEGNTSSAKTAIFPWRHSLQPLTRGYSDRMSAALGLRSRR